MLNIFYWMTKTNIISSIHTRGVMVAMTLLGNDGTELIKMVSPENMSIKIEEVKKVEAILIS